ncbi:peptidoglycan-binding protein [Desertibaculum subflavum]|uniref:peptidoglycan-binding protein n=1 Tax=Desertibaculum subflavum TaxID=2268458 RepID=UPI0034D188AD
MRAELFRQLLFAVPILGVVACGDRADDRAISGAGIGAAAGLALGAVTGLSLLEGAALGAAVGGVTGAVTDSSDVNLGKPAWRRDSASTQPSQTARGNDLVYRTQTALAARGYDVGTADGILGPRTRNAIELYQRQNSLVVDGKPGEALLRHIEGRS